MPALQESVGEIEQEESVIDGSAEFPMTRNPFGYQPWRDKRSFAVSLYHQARGIDADAYRPCSTF